MNHYTKILRIESRVCPQITVMESLSPRKRYIVTLTVGLGYSTGMALVPVVAYWLSDWNLVHLAPPAMVAILLVTWM